MVKKLRWILPTVQVPFAILMLVLGHAQDRATSMEYVGVSWATRTCYAVNAPAVLFRGVGVYLWGLTHINLGTPAETTIDDAVFIIGVGLQWYFVGREVSSRFRADVCKSTTPMTVAKDVGLILVGVLLGLWAVGISTFGYDMSQRILFLVWSLALISVYGLDFARTVARKHLLSL